MKKYILIVLISFVSYAPVSNASALQLFWSIYEMIQKNISIIQSKLSTLKSGGKALINASKVAADTVSINILEVEKYSQKNLLVRGIGDGNSEGPVTVESGMTGNTLRISSIAPSACLRQANSDLSYDIAKNVEPIVSVLKDKINGVISQQETSSQIVRENSTLIANMIKSSDKTSINPFNLSVNINNEQADKLVDIIAFIVNKNPPSNRRNANSGFNQFDYHVKRIRYEEYVKVVNQTFVNHIKYFIVGQEGESQRDLISRIRAKANAISISEAMVVKYESGNLKEVNGTMSDVLMIDIINQKIKKDNLALLALIATATTDDMATGL